MTKTIKVSDVQIGMYIILPKGFLSYIRHPFIKSEFIVDTEKKRNDLIHSGLKEVQYDPARSKKPAETKKQEEKDPVIYDLQEPVPPNWDPKKNMSQALIESISNQTLSPHEKAKHVYEDSLGLMHNLFQSPTAEKIVESKQSIYKMVDMILSEDDTSLNLLKLINHDFYTYTHSVNVGVLSVSLAKRLYKNDDSHDMHELGAGFFLHDLGKVTIDPAILNKPGKLDEKEMRRMRSHPGQSMVILKKAGELSLECGIIAMQHHEREDGTGYPMGLKGDEIHDYGRICCIADVYDALTAERSYKKAKTTFEALRIMKEEMYNHFHKEIFESFVRLFE